MNISYSFAKYGSRLMTAELKESTFYHARRALIDWYAALMAGSQMKVSQIVEKSCFEDLDRGFARLPLGRSATVRCAALINGTASHAAEVDDIFREAIYHPGSPTISAALAMAEHLDKNGEQLLRSIIVGYEVSTRIGRSLGRAHYRYWHNTGTVGAFGAASATAVLLELEDLPFSHALSTVATFASGLQAAFQVDSMSKPLHSGRAAEAGILAATLAEKGIVGAFNVLESSQGFGVAMSENVNWDMALSDLGMVFHIENMTFKNHACCGHTFAPIDGALVLQKDFSINSSDIEAVRIGTYKPALDVAGAKNPQTAAEARFSIPYVVACALLYGSVRLTAFSEDRLNDSNVRALMKKIELYVDPEADRLFPNKRSAHIEIKVKSGKAFNFYQPTRKGDPDMPLSDQELGEKFLELVSPVLGEETARKKLSLLLGFDRKKSARELLA